MTQLVLAGEIYGPDLGWNGLVPRLALRLTRLRTEAESAPPVTVKLPLPGDPAARHALLHVDDAVAALRLVATCGAPGESYTLGGVEEVTLGDLARRIARLLRVDVDVERGAPALPTAPRADTARLVALGWAPRVTLDAGLEAAVAWYSAHVHLAPAELA